MEVLFQHSLSVFYKSQGRIESNLMLNNGHLLSERQFFALSDFQHSWKFYLTPSQLYPIRISNNCGFTLSFSFLVSSTFSIFLFQKVRFSHVFCDNLNFLARMIPGKNHPVQPCFGNLPLAIPGSRSLGGEIVLSQCGSYCLCILPKPFQNADFLHFSELFLAKQAMKRHFLLLWKRLFSPSFAPFLTPFFPVFPARQPTFVLVFP